MADIQIHKDRPIKIEFTMEETRRYWDIVERRNQALADADADEESLDGVDIVIQLSPFGNLIMVDVGGKHIDLTE